VPMGKSFEAGWVREEKTGRFGRGKRKGVRTRKKKGTRVAKRNQNSWFRIRPGCIEKS